MPVRVRLNKEELEDMKGFKYLKINRLSEYRDESRGKSQVEQSKERWEIWIVCREAEVCPAVKTGMLEDMVTQTP